MGTTNNKPSPQLTLYPKSDFLVRLRETKGLSQKEVEQTAGLPKSRLYHYEKGRPIPFLHLRMLAAAYAVPLRDLVEENSLQRALEFFKELSSFNWTENEIKIGKLMHL